MKTVNKPWGSFTVIKEPHNVDDRTKVCLKKLLIAPGQSLSLQSHEYREEFWYILQGIGRVELSNRSFEVVHGNFVNIRVGRRHRLSNKNDTMLVVIEMSIGPKIDENDIKRYKDQYGRI